MKERFVDKNFSPEQSELIKVCDRITDQYRRQGYDLSLRQLYYRLVAANIIPNSVRAYKFIGELINNARLAGLIDWEMIVDRGRVSQAIDQVSAPSVSLRHLAKCFRLDCWRDQPVYIEVMVEKQALEGVLWPVCAKYGVTFTSNKGYCSASTFYRTSKRIARAVLRDKKQPVVLYAGDHDPSGQDMTRDVRERLRMFCGFDVDVKRLALNRSQVDEHQLPPNPAKMSDSRAKKYVEKHGVYSWELDALPPNILAAVIESAIVRRIDKQKWIASKQRESAYREKLEAVARIFQKRENDSRK